MPALYSDFYPVQAFHSESTGEFAPAGLAERHRVYCNAKTASKQHLKQPAFLKLSLERPAGSITRIESLAGVVNQMRLTK
jgi:hypothetical protein